MKMSIIYEDNHLLVAFKPANMPVQADASGDTDLLSELKAYIKQKYQKPGAVYLGLVHRLDRPVSGLVAFARTSKAAARLSAQLQSREMGREYLCVAQGTAPQSGKAEHYLLKNEKTNTSSVVSPQTPGAKRAKLEFERLGFESGLSLLRVRLTTGRSHQIRVQMKALGFPLWGDSRYGGGKPGEQLALFAQRLHLRHPVTGEELRFEAPSPKRFPFSLFP
ncbi:MAG: RluA family pseudouridine synthase [Christensenellaceae bacterium]|jgi:23S rRNA pseudouridine1911/1915/1917 synthase|nr:RluA family pseudouridine synthase [Christensenellaceae bacterium]